MDSHLSISKLTTKLQYSKQCGPGIMIDPQGTGRELKYSKKKKKLQSTDFQQGFQEYLTQKNQPF